MQVQSGQLEVLKWNFLAGCQHHYLQLPETPDLDTLTIGSKCWTRPAINGMDVCQQFTCTYKQISRDFSTLCKPC